MRRGKLVMTLLSLVLVSLPSAVNAEKRGVKVVPTQDVRVTPWGDYYALVIGINQYQEWPYLRTAVNDVKGLKSLLVKRYGFADERTILLTDGEATRG
ncbi:MAG: caspase family protein, partial [Deltaproteobacteria bacterium]|nr:caspase family protein [Deltaproteobacteria bacterium]